MKREIEMCENNKQEAKKYSTITPAEAYQVMGENNDLNDLVRKHKVLYAEGYFVIADSRYVYLDINGYHLTQEAKENMHDCIICIEEKESSPVSGYFNTGGIIGYGLPNQEFIRRFKVGECSKLIIDDILKKEKLIITNDEGKEIINSTFFDIEGEKELIKMIGNPDCTLCQCLVYLFKRRNWYPETFVNETLLHRDNYSKIQNNTQKSNNMSAKTLFAICVGLRLSKGLTEQLFTKSNNQLNKYKSPYCYYLHILENTPYISIAEFNDILIEWELAPLGTKQREKKEK